MNREIVVGLDPSPSGTAALQWAARYARLTRDPLRAVHVLHWPAGYSASGLPIVADAVALSADEVAEGYRIEITRIFTEIDPEPSWRLEFVMGDPGYVLVQESRDGQLLVVGTREHVGLGRLIAGSISHYCLHHARCPVVAVPADTAADILGTSQIGTAAMADAKTERQELPESTVEHPQRGRVAVGVDPSAESVAAARYAVQAADLRGFDLLMVHGYAPPGLNLASTEALERRLQAGRDLVTNVAAQLRVPTATRLDTLIEPVPPAELLESVAESANLLVLGQDHVNWTGSLKFGRTASLVAAVAGCPVVVVPGGWVARQTGGPLPVVVAVDGETSAEPALRLAFEEASLRRTSIVALHAAAYTASGTEVAEDRVGLSELLAGWKQDYPDVEVETAVVRGDADVALPRWSRRAGALVVGRPHHRGWGTWTRSIARTVLQHTHCPLIIPGRQGVRAAEPATTGHRRAARR